MTDYILKAESGHINVSPIGFRFAAQDFFKCYLDFRPQRQFSIIPYFLCCRAIELALKAIHLEAKHQADVKKEYWHNLVKLYEGLQDKQPTLSHEELDLLKQANQIYSNKDFEYFNVYDAGMAFGRYPELDALGRLARKITRYTD